MVAGTSEPKDLWRVAVLTMMGPGALSSTLLSEDAAAWVEAAAACGISAAQLRLGRMLLEGEGIPKNKLAAFSCFVVAAAHGNIEAHNMLGRCHENGWGTQISHSEAAREYHIAAEAGLDWAQYNLGHMLLSGSGVERDRDAAFTWYNRAAAQDHIRAMNLVARCYENGWGVENNALEAFEWFRRSARGGYFRGAFNYATLLAEDGCVAGALHWFERALTTAPEPTRSNMIASLNRRSVPAIRALAMHFPRHRTVHHSSLRRPEGQ
jgi:hypothetical protein